MSGGGVKPEYVDKILDFVLEGYKSRASFFVEKGLKLIGLYIDGLYSFLDVFTKHPPSDAVSVLEKEYKFLRVMSTQEFGTMYYPFWSIIFAKNDNLNTLTLDRKWFVDVLKKSGVRVARKFYSYFRSHLEGRSALEVVETVLDKLFELTNLYSFGFTNLIHTYKIGYKQIKSYEDFITHSGTGTDDVVLDIFEDIHLAGAVLESVVGVNREYIQKAGRMNKDEIRDVISKNYVLVYSFLVKNVSYLKDFAGLRDEWGNETFKRLNETHRLYFGFRETGGRVEKYLRILELVEEKRKSLANFPLEFGFKYGGVVDGKLVLYYIPELVLFVLFAFFAFLFTGNLSYLQDVYIVLCSAEALFVLTVLVEEKLCDLLEGLEFGGDSLSERFAFITVRLKDYFGGVFDVGVGVQDEFARAYGDITGDRVGDEDFDGEVIGFFKALLSRAAFMLTSYVRGQEVVVAGGSSKLPRPHFITTPTLTKSMAVLVLQVMSSLAGLGRRVEEYLKLDFVKSLKSSKIERDLGFVKTFASILNDPVSFSVSYSYSPNEISFFKSFIVSKTSVSLGLFLKQAHKLKSENTLEHIERSVILKYINSFVKLVWKILGLVGSKNYSFV